MAKHKIPDTLNYNPSLAITIGLNEAIIVSQVEYWLSKNFKNKQYKKDADGREWMYNSYSEWASNFPFWSKNTIIRAIESAESKGVLLSKLKGRGRIARSKWYSLNTEKINSYLLEVETTQNGYSQSGINSEGTQNGYFNGERTTQNGYFAQAITKNTNITNNTFPLKKENLPINTTVHKEKLAPRLDTSSGTGTEITPNNLASIQVKCPTATAKLINSTWIEQEGYWREKNLSNYLLEGKVIARIINQEAKKRKKIFVQE